MSFIYVTYDAISEMVSLRQFHGPEYDEGMTIVKIVRRAEYEMPRCPILTQESENGVVIYTGSKSKDKGFNNP